MKHKEYILKIFLNFFSYLLDPALSLFPRNKKKWLFGSMGGMKDNPKYLFYSTLELHPEIRSIWIAHKKQDVEFLREKRIEVYYWLSWKGLYHALSAKVFIGDHHVGNVNQLLSGGAYFVNLWHGSSVKRVRWQALEYIVKKYKLSDQKDIRSSFRLKMELWPILFRKPDLCLAPSTIQAENFFAPMMDIPLEKCIVGVYPRSRFLIEGKASAIKFIAKYESEKTMGLVNKIKLYSKTYIYMPTWRNGNINFLLEAEIDWSSLNEILKRKNELFILKMHPSTNLNFDSLLKYSNIAIFPSQSDIYTLLPFIDSLITDYSSIYTDFLMMNKEIILFVFDLDDYLRSNYNLAEYDKYYVGKRAYKFSQLLEIIESGEDCHVPQDKYQELMEFFWDNNRHKIDIVEEVKKRIGL